MVDAAVDLFSADGLNSGEEEETHEFFEVGFSFGDGGVVAFEEVDAVGLFGGGGVFEGDAGGVFDRLVLAEIALGGDEGCFVFGLVFDGLSDECGGAGEGGEGEVGSDAVDGDEGDFWEGFIVRVHFWISSYC